MISLPSWMLGDRFRNPPETVRAAYRALGDVVGAAGDDPAGRLVTRDQDGEPRPVD
jgi:hypothetical protein